MEVMPTGSDARRRDGPLRRHHLLFHILGGVAGVLALQPLATQTYVFINNFACMFYFIIFLEPCKRLSGC